MSTQDVLNKFSHGDLVLIRSTICDGRYFGEIGIVDNRMLLGSFVYVQVPVESSDDINTSEKFQGIGFNIDEVEVLEKKWGVT